MHIYNLIYEDWGSPNKLCMWPYIETPCPFRVKPSHELTESRALDKYNMHT